jgi:transposase
MPPAIHAQVRDQVIKEWLSGNTRNEIATKNKIGAGTVSNIINEWKKGLDNSEYESIRELAAFSKKEAMTLSDMAENVRLNNYIRKLGADLEKIESFIANCCFRMIASDIHP